MLEGSSNWPGPNFDQTLEVGFWDQQQQKQQQHE